MPFGRFIVPIWPIVSFVFGLWFADVLGRLRRTNLFALQRWLPQLCWCAMVTCSVFAWQAQVRAYATNKEMNMLMRGDDQLKVGRWLDEHVKPGATVATGRIGAMSYAAPQLVFFDLNGLTDAGEAHFIARGRPGRVDDDPVLQRNPDVIAAIDVPVDWGYKQDTAFVKWMSPRYELVCSLPQGNFGGIDIWISKQSFSMLLQRN